jgi:hypothetical protein
MGLDRRGRGFQSQCYCRWFIAQSGRFRWKPSLDVHYIAPECFENALTLKSDVLSFGLILCRLFSPWLGFLGHLQPTTLTKQILVDEIRPPIPDFLRADVRRSIQSCWPRIRTNCRRLWTFCLGWKEWTSESRGVWNLRQFVGMWTLWNHTKRFSGSRSKAATDSNLRAMAEIRPTARMAIFHSAFRAGLKFWGKSHTQRLQRVAKHGRSGDGTVQLWGRALLTLSWIPFEGTRSRSIVQAESHPTILRGRSDRQNNQITWIDKRWFVTWTDWNSLWIEFKLVSGILSPSIRISLETINWEFHFMELWSI